MNLITFATNLRDVFQTEKNWTSGSLARDEDGNSVKVNSPEAVCWCLLGGILKVGDYQPIEYKIVAINYFQKICGSGPITVYNDRNTFAKLTYHLDNFKAYAEANKAMTITELVATIKN